MCLDVAMVVLGDSGLVLGLFRMGLTKMQMTGRNKVGCGKELNGEHVR